MYNITKQLLLKTGDYKRAANFALATVETLMNKSFANDPNIAYYLEMGAFRESSIDRLAAEAAKVCGGIKKEVVKTLSLFKFSSHWYDVQHMDAEGHHRVMMRRISILREAEKL